MEEKTKELNAPVHAEYDEKYFGPPVAPTPQEHRGHRIRQDKVELAAALRRRDEPVRTVERMAVNTQKPTVLITGVSGNLGLRLLNS